MQLQKAYHENIKSELKKELGFANELDVPRLTKIVVNMGLGEAIDNKKILDSMAEQLALITGQKPMVTRAKRAIATFKLRAGMPIGLKVTMRGKRMFAFFERLVGIALPRVRDFRGILEKTFDKHGNLNIGFSELTVFPEVKYETLDKIRGLEITIVTTARDPQSGKALLEKLGFPFEKKVA